ncbi:MAG: glycosyltransferase [Kiritimatiellae bacterium]|jgi:glycosyltransferase involved in cell wall biosynthesis|nr:glycosyltransferase [Kiritimatiellia bacterium]
MNIGIYLKNFPSNRNFAKRSMGALKYVDGMANGLSDNGATITILCERDITKVIKTSKYDIQVFKSCHLNPFALSIEFKKHIKNSNLDICLVFGMFHTGVYALSRQLKNARIPYVFCPMDPYNDALFANGALKKWIYWHLFEKRLIKQSALVELFNGVHEKFINEHKVYPRCYTTALAIADDQIPEITKDWNTENETIRIMFQGRIDIQNKGLDLLVKAFTQVTDTHDNIELIMQGYPQDNAKLQKLIENLGMTQRISILPPDFSVSSTESIMRNNPDLFCLSSRFEGFSFAVVEAMLLELPVVVTSFAGIAPFVKESNAGYIVESTVESIRDGLLNAIKDRENWPEKGKTGRKYILETLQWEKIAYKNLEGYKHLLSTIDEKK